MLVRIRFDLLVLVCVGCLLSLASAFAQESTPEATPDAVIYHSTSPDLNSFDLVPVLSGLFRPLFLTGAGDGSGRIFVMEQTGRILIVRDGTLAAAPFLDLSALVSQDVRFGYSERGLLGLAFHPDYATNGRFFVNYTDANGTTQVVEYRVSAGNPDAADPASARTLLTVGQPYPNHNGGHLAFGPDGYLYIAMGDGGLRDDPLGAGQDRGVLLGKLLRIDVDDYDFARPYGIPLDNPFALDPTLAPEIWALGLRNPWRFSFDRATGDLYIGDVGQNNWEEINFQPAGAPGGANYGWVIYEANTRYRTDEPTSAVTFPIAVYSHGAGSCSVTGGYVYRGAEVPALQGYYFFSDYCSGVVWSAWRSESGAWQSTEIARTGRQISSFGQDDSGELYLIDYNDGAILKITSRR